ncbi:MAG: adenosylmethionine decarboxylase [Armatimonadetes bacterium]|nr:adenosylmethionine decarboxylase [Armatimonadota bacterium]
MDSDHVALPSGVHLLIDLWGATRLDDVEAVRAALLDAVTATGAQLIDYRLHHFSPGGGVTAIALLATSHLSLHTWPEHGYCAVDVFTCGPCDPHAVLPVLRAAFEPERVEVVTQRRGVRDAETTHAD